MRDKNRFKQHLARKQRTASSVVIPQRSGGICFSNHLNTTSENASRPQTTDIHAADAEPQPQAPPGDPIDQARTTLLEAMPDAAKTLADKAREGSVAHMKLMAQLLGLEKGGLKPKEITKREKSLEQILLERWEMEP